MKHITLIETTNAAGRVIPAGSEIEIHESEVNKFAALGIIKGKGKKFKTKKPENAMMPKEEIETR